MDVRDETFADHFVSKKCQQDFKEAAPSKGEIEKMIKDLHPVCTNRKTQSGWDIGLFAPDAIVKYKEGKKTYCFAPGDKIYDFKRKEYVNPFTQNVIKRDKGSEIDSEMGKNPAPLLTEYIYPVCPVFRSSDPLVRFVFKTIRNDYVTRNRAMSTDSEIIYRGVLKKDWMSHQASWITKGKDIGVYEEHQFEEIKPVYDPSVQFKGLKRDRKIGGYGNYSLGVKPEADLDKYFDMPVYKGIGSTYQALKTYMSHSEFYMTEPLAKDLKEQKIRLNKPIQVYRGLRIDLDDPIWDSVHLGEIVTLEDIHAASSWTTDVCIAAGFAFNGVVVTYLAQPSEVVLDTRLLEPKILEDLYHEIQFEVILDKGKRKVKIELILYRDHQVPYDSYLGFDSNSDDYDSDSDDYDSDSDDYDSD